MADLSWFWRLRGLHGAHVPLARELLAALGNEPPEDLAEEYVLCVINTVSGDGNDPREPERLARAEAVLASRDHALRRPFVVVLWSVAYGPQYAVQERVRRRGRRSALGTRAARRRAGLPGVVHGAPRHVGAAFRAGARRIPGDRGPVGHGQLP